MRSIIRAREARVWFWGRSKIWKEAVIKTLTIDVRMMWSSGIGSYIRNLLPRIMALRPEDQFVLLGVPSEMELWPGFKAANAQWLEVHSSVFSLSAQKELPRKIPKDSDLFWSPNYNFPLFYRGKLLSTVHDVFHLANPRFVHGPHRKAYARIMFDRMMARADAVLCVSHFSKSELCRLTGGDARKVRVIHNGVDDFWAGAVEDQRPHAKPYLLFVGNVKPHKNLGRLLEAFSLLKDKIPHDLIIVGKKEGFITGDPEVVRQAEAFGERVHFTGLISDRELRRFYAFTDLLVFPSLYEGFGLPPLEAMAAGTPVACSRTASLPEVCGDAAIYFDPYSPLDISRKIEQGLGTQDLRERLIERGKERVRQFDWDQCAVRTNEVIGELLTGKGSENPLRGDGSAKKTKLVLVNNYHYYRGGAEKVFLDQAELFRAMGNEVHLFSQKHPLDLADADREWFPPWRDPKRFGFMNGLLQFLRFVYIPGNRRLFRRFLRFVKPDLIHVHNLYGGLTTAVLDAAKDMRIPVVMTLHDYKVISPSPNLMSGSEFCRDCLVNPDTPRCILRRCHRGDLKSTLAYYWETWFNRRFRKYDSVRAFIAPSRFMAETVIRAGLDPAKVQVVPNALEAGRRLQVEGSRNYFLYAARMTDEKGMEVLIKAAEGSTANVVAAGEGPRLEAYREMARQNPNIRFVGSLGPEQMEKNYRDCLAVVVPSLWYENASMTVLEAMAHGKPVIASRIGGLPEQVEDGVNGLVVESGDHLALKKAMDRLSSEAGLAERLGKNARTTFEQRYSHQTYYERLLEVYQRVLGQNKKAGRQK